MTGNGNILHKGPMGWQEMGIYSTQDQWDGRKWEYTPHGTNEMTRNGNILHTGPMR
jgi:hypothetical protein